MDTATRSSFKELLGLEREPAALRWCSGIPKDLPRAAKKERFCVKLGRATLGESFYSTGEEEECMGGGKYCGLCDDKELPASRRSGEFLVSMGIYRSVAAVQRAWRGNMLIEPGIFKALAFAPLSGAPFDPDVVVVLCTARQGMELLHANAYDSGARGIGADAGPICSSMAAVPYLTGKVTYGFGDAGSRDRMGMGPDGVLVSIPGSDLARIVSNLREMRSRKAFGA